eukprot:scaffold62304_cov48-Phaeocystis_antarctica.AAC.1
MRRSACSTGLTSQSGGFISASSMAEIPSDQISARPLYDPSAMTSLGLGLGLGLGIGLGLGVGLGL